MTSRSFWRQSTNWNGPVPIRSRSQVSVLSSCAWATMPMRPEPNSAAGSAGHGSLVVTVSVRSSTTSTVSMFANTKTNSSGLRVGVYWPR